METHLVNPHGCAACQVPRQLLVLTCPTMSWSKPGVGCGNGRSRISCDNAPHGCCSCMRPPSCPMSRQPQRCPSLPTPCGSGGGAGPMGCSTWKMRPAADGRSALPPLDQACVKAVACEAVHHTALPLRRRSTVDLAAQARRALSKPISPSTVWRIPMPMPSHPGSTRMGFFPARPTVSQKRGTCWICLLDTGKEPPLVPRIPSSAPRKRPVSRLVSGAIPACHRRLGARGVSSPSMSVVVHGHTWRPGMGGAALLWGGVHRRQASSRSDAWSRK